MNIKKMYEVADKENCTLSKHAVKIVNAIEKKGGYCPCTIRHEEDTLCPCLVFREGGECTCGLFIRDL